MTPKQTERLKAYLAVHKLSKGLRGFFADWLAWVERGAPEGEPYSGGDSLCFAMNYYKRVYAGLNYEFENLRLGVFGRKWVYPFGRNNYNCREITRTHHKDPKRLAFVRAVLDLTKAPNP